MDSTESLIRFLQSSISPIVLISGVGLLLLSLSNRLGRTTDKSREIVKELRSTEAKFKKRKTVQLKILYRRSKILRLSIVSISFSILTSSLIIPILLIMNLVDINLKVIGIVLFLLSVLGIIFSAILLFLDVTLSLKALDLEVKEYI
ncbi:MAG: DUF2721 domain-containing protein [Candidatus Marinimicrobia bacterium]|nr:DUF2721 domain-containing protein [Candidatus Neomarinimicrobiota bacterium]